MAIIDLDSHLRDGWLLDEIYQLPESYAKYSPRRIGVGHWRMDAFARDKLAGRRQDPRRRDGRLRRQ